MSLTDIFGSQASGRATRGRTPIFRMAVSGEPLDTQIQDVTITMGENLHDTVTMTVSSTERTSTEGLQDSPISFLYGTPPRTEVFSGYITSVSEGQGQKGVLSWTMSIAGPTKPLQTGKPRFWTNKTIPSAVESLAFGSYLGYIGHAHTHIWPTLAQTNESDWKVITNLAGRLGWSVFNRFGVVGLYDPLLLLQENGSAHTFISESYTIAKTEIDQARTLLEFEPSEMAPSDVEQQGLKVAYFQGDTVQVASQLGKHASYRYLNNFVVRNDQEAKLYVNSRYSNASNWRQQAKARVMGNAGVFPGMNVEIQTTNPKYYRGKFNGRWFVRAVQHKMDRQDFQSNLVLARPSSTTEVYAGSYAPFWQQATKPKPLLTLTESVSESEVPQSMWVSSWANPTARSVA